MFVVTTRERLARAIERARELHPTVRVVRFGLYQVSGSEGNFYTVRCFRDERNQKIVACECPTKDGIPCKHGAAVIPLHSHMAAERRRLAEH